MSGQSPWNRKAAKYTAILGGAAFFLAAIIYLLGWGKWQSRPAFIEEAVIRLMDGNLKLLVTYSVDGPQGQQRYTDVLATFSCSQMETAREYRELLLTQNSFDVFVSSDGELSPRLKKPPPTLANQTFTASLFFFVIAGLLFTAPGLAQGLASFSVRRKSRDRRPSVLPEQLEPKNMVIHLVSSPYLSEQNQCLARANILMGRDNEDDLRFEVVVRGADNYESMGAEQGDTITLGDTEFDELFIVRTNFADRIDRLLDSHFRKNIKRFYELYETKHCSIMLNRHCLTMRKAVPIAEAETVDLLKGQTRDITHSVFAFLGVPQLVQSIDIVLPPGGLVSHSTEGSNSPSHSGLSNPQLDELLTEELPSHYIDLQIIGRGGMGAVFQAMDKRNSNKVAIKILDPRFANREAVIRRFYRETVATANLRHENIPRIMDVKRGRLPYYVMEYVEGAPLDRVLRERKSLAPAETVDIACQVAKALAIAHENSIVHRDVKPSNIIVAKDGVAKVVDFGIAHFDEDSDLTSSGQSLGTPQYMSPEQMEGKDVGPETDIYSLGVVLFECLAGELPFPARAPFARVFKDPPHLLQKRADTPAELASLIMRCLDKNPDVRFTNGTELLEELKGCMAKLELNPSHIIPSETEDDEQTIDGIAAPAPIYVSDENLKKQLVLALPSRYSDVNHVGRGGMGAVFVAVDNESGNLVAIKVLDPRYLTSEELVRRFYRETIAISNLRHGNIPKIMDVKRGELPYFIMEFVPGESLDKILARKGKLTEKETISLAGQVASALAAAHEASIIHRDVKPANIIVTDEGIAKVLDFGLAHLDEGTALTQTGQPLGTPRYMSPEQIQGMQTEFSTDVYSLGYTMYEMATANQPFSPGTPLERAYMQPRRLTKSDGITTEFSALIMRCLEKDPKARFANGQELTEALSRLANDAKTN